MTQVDLSQKGILANVPVHAVLAVDDIAASKAFYIGKLGLTAAEESAEGVMLEAGGGTKLYIYARPGAPKAVTTVASFVVDSVKDSVAALRDNGIAFEEYDMPGLKTVDGVAESEDGNFIGAWFKDPDGNIIAVSQLQD